MSEPTQTSQNPLYLLAAVETVVPGACPQTKRIAQAPEPPPTAVLANFLSNELDALTLPVVLVLDDYHRIRGESEVHELMRFCWCTRQGPCVLMRGRPDPTVGSVRSNQPPAREAMLWWLEIPALTRCRALIAEGSSTSLAATQERLRGYAALNEAHHNPGQLIGILALQALAYARKGEVEDALGALERALTLARPGWAWLFVKLGPTMAALLQRLRTGLKDRFYIDGPLAIFPEQVVSAKAWRPAVGAVPAGDVSGVGLSNLTAREEQNLELLAERLRDKEIADRLSIAAQTVNFHLDQVA